MAKYFKNVKSYEDLKKQYRKLVVANHPDNGGTEEAIKGINIEYDALFAVWKHKQESETGKAVNETAASTRAEFYTQNGWEGSNHSWSRSLKEVAQIVRTYVKENYPTYKFSVRTSYASMCQELHVALKESPIEIYKTFEELTDEDKNDLVRKMRYNGYFELNSWFDHELKVEFERVWNEHGNFYKCLNEVTQAVINDVDNFVNSYNFEDCDSQIDYFHVDFYYFGCLQNNGKDVKIVPKTARIKNKTTAPEKAKRNTTKREKTAKIEDKELVKSDVTYKVTQGEDTRDGSILWIVRIVESLSKDAYIEQNKKIKSLGGYYSKFKHGFLFRFDPTEKLGGAVA